MVITIAKNMPEYNYHHNSLLTIAVISALLAGVQPLISSAADWKITPRLNLKETYSDNVGLSSGGGASGVQGSDFITEINPGVSVTGTGSHLKLNGSYTMQNIFYANNGSRNRIVNQLNANANAELLDDLFFVDGRASISQQNISTFGAQSTDNININSNRTDVKTYSISPYIRHKFGSFASTEARYTHNSVSSGFGGFSDSQQDSVDISLTSGSSFKNFGWGFNVNHQTIDYSQRKPVDSNRLSGNVSYAVIPEVRLTVTGGYENNNFLASDNTVSTSGKNQAGAFWSAGLTYIVTPEFSLNAKKGHENNFFLASGGQGGGGGSGGQNAGGDFWTAGFAWNPTQRTSIAANIGQRFFGDTYSLTASHHSRRTAWSLAYSEDVTSSRSQFLIPVTIDTAAFLDQLWSSSITDPVLRQQFVEAFINNNGLPSSLADSLNFLTNRYFLQKRLQASMSVLGARNTLVFSVFDMRRDAQSGQTMDSQLIGPSNLSLNDNTDQVGVNATWSYRISPRTNANVSAGYTQSSSHPSNNKTNSTNFRMSINKQFRPKINGMLEVRHNEQSNSASQFGSSQNGNGYGENAVAASLNMTF